ncbi:MULTISPECIES: VOC family protein [unclassified Streptomyces]|uniref:VOC family protein n=2 Tax=unclassified Streptomyces TaxID=2593676 RepID=UPI0035DFD452
MDDFDAVYRRMKEAGCACLGDGCTFIAGEVTPEAALGTKVAYFNDPDGISLEIIRPEGGFAGRGARPARVGPGPTWFRTPPAFARLPPSPTIGDKQMPALVFNPRMQLLLEHVRRNSNRTEDGTPCLSRS